jgi:hypothetical protein
MLQTRLDGSCRAPACTPPRADLRICPGGTLVSCAPLFAVLFVGGASALGALARARSSDGDSVRARRARLRGAETVSSSCSMVSRTRPPDTFADLRSNVHDFWDRGLLGMALDPGFTTGGCTSPCSTPITLRSAARRRRERRLSTPTRCDGGRRSHQRPPVSVDRPLATS